MDKGLDHLEQVKAKVKSVQEAVGGGGAQPDPVMDYEGRKKEMEEIFAMADAAPSRKEEVEKKLPGVFSEKEAEEKRHGGGGKKRWRGPEAVARVGAAIEKKRTDQRRAQVEKIIRDAKGDVVYPSG